MQQQPTKIEVRPVNPKTTPLLYGSIKFQMKTKFNLEPSSLVPLRVLRGSIRHRGPVGSSASVQCVSEPPRQDIKPWDAADGQSSASGTPPLLLLWGKTTKANHSVMLLLVFGFFLSCGYIRGEKIQWSQPHKRPPPFSWQFQIFKYHFQSLGVWQQSRKKSKDHVCERRFKETVQTNLTFLTQHSLLCKSGLWRISNPHNQSGLSQIYG